FETPFRFYADRDHPLTSFGFHAYVAGTRPVSDLPQKQDLYLRNYVPLIIDHTPANVPAQWWPARLRETFTLDSSAPFAVLVLIALVGLLTAPRLQWAVLGSLPLFVILYACYVFFLPHYTIIVAPAIIVAIVIGLRALPQLAPLRAQRMVSAWLMIMTIGLTVAALPQWDATANDQMFASPMIGSVNEALASLGGQRVVVLFRYDPQRNVHEEPVYNADVAWPDDAQIIRAHDRGIENTRIYRYYAEHQPDRVFYRFDEATKSLQRLGSATALAAQSK
ncbi:MAG TPA: hypothetical protein VLI90_05845, partial [Tepidisphaeraceae bacterium]|nr:hypothetical protein [Tepidisphaeraceae bacterium]